jgi:pheromone shutdown protein TraB
MSDLADDSRLVDDTGRRLRALEAGQKELVALIRAGFDKIEGRFEKNETRLQKIGEDLAELKGRVSQLPTTVTLLGFVLAVLAMAGVLKVFVH